MKKGGGEFANWKKERKKLFILEKNRKKRNTTDTYDVLKKNKGKKICEKIIQRIKKIN